MQIELQVVQVKAPPAKRGRESAVARTPPGYTPPSSAKVAKSRRVAEDTDLNVSLLLASDQNHGTNLNISGVAWFVVLQAFSLQILESVMTMVPWFSRSWDDLPKWLEDFEEEEKKPRGERKELKKPDIYVSARSALFASLICNTNHSTSTGHGVWQGVGGCFRSCGALHATHPTTANVVVVIGSVVFVSCPHDNWLRLSCKTKLMSVRVVQMSCAHDTQYKMSCKSLCCRHMSCRCRWVSCICRVCTTDVWC
jgi:hypothetical protein